MVDSPYEKLPRSALYVPGDSPEKLQKALDRGADEVIIDLEDAVRPDHKESALNDVVHWLNGKPGTTVPVWVRINPGVRRLHEVRTLAACEALHGVVVAKTETAAELYAVDEVLTSLGSSARIIPLLESARAVFDAREIADVPRVQRLQVGEADLRAEIGATLGVDEREMLHVRSHIILASAAARISPPIAPVSTQFRDLDSFRNSTLALSQLGFVGRACIHPAQVAVSNEVFTPSAERVEEARRLLEQFSDSGVGVGEDGEMVDEAVLRSARRILSQARDSNWQEK